MFKQCQQRFTRSRFLLPRPLPPSFTIPPPLFSTLLSRSLFLPLSFTLFSLITDGTLFTGSNHFFSPSHTHRKSLSLFLFVTHKLSLSVCFIYTYICSWKYRLCTICTQVYPNGWLSLFDSWIILYMSEINRRLNILVPHSHHIHF